MFFVGTSAAFADPLQYIPTQSNFVLKIEKPRAFAEAITEHKFLKQYQQLPQLKKVLESTNFKRGFQLLAHMEKKLGAKWPELLDDLGSNGIALGTVTSIDPAPLVFILEGKSEKRTAELWDALLAIVEEEVQRDAPQAKIEPKTEGKIRYFDGGEFLTAQLGTTIAITNNKEAGKAIGKLLMGEGKSLLANDSVLSAKKLLGGEPLAWLWYDLDQLKQTQAAKDFFESTKKELVQTLAAGSTIDAVSRSHFVAAGIYLKAEAITLQVKLPAKRSELAPEMALHAPKDAGTPGTLPLLLPPGTTYSQTVYLDLATLWTDRKRLLNDEVRKGFEDGEKQINKLLPNTTLGKLMEMSGPHHRLVMMERGKNQYRHAPEYPLPEMALVTSMRDPKFGRKMTTALRIALAAASSNYTLELADLNHDGIDITSYRFSETKPYADDPTNFRLNFAPSFAVVNENFIMATSPGIIKALIPELKKPIDPGQCRPAVLRSQITGDGLAQALLARPDRLLSSRVLELGMSLSEAKLQLNALAKVLSNAGTVNLNIDHTAEAYILELVWDEK